MTSPSSRQWREAALTLRDHAAKFEKLAEEAEALERLEGRSVSPAEIEEAYMKLRRAALKVCSVTPSELGAALRELHGLLTPERPSPAEPFGTDTEIRGRKR
jgi:hypothetical protein